MNNMRRAVACLAATDMDRVNVTAPGGQSVWIHRLLISGACGSLLILLVAVELHKKLVPATSYSSMLKRVKDYPNCGTSSPEQLALLKRKGVMLKGAASARLITAEAATHMLRPHAGLGQVLDAITAPPRAAPQAATAQPAARVKTEPGSSSTPSTAPGTPPHGAGSEPKAARHAPPIQPAGPRLPGQLGYWRRPLPSTRSVALCLVHGWRRGKPLALRSCTSRSGAT